MAEKQTETQAAAAEASSAVNRSKQRIAHRCVSQKKRLLVAGFIAHARGDYRTTTMSWENPVKFE